jgi:hypothetical protein
MNDHYFLNSLFEEGCENEIICQIKKKETLHVERCVKEIHFIVSLVFIRETMICLLRACGIFFKMLKGANV